MSDVVAYQPPLLAQARRDDNRLLLRQLILLSVPVLAENLLHQFVNLTDTSLANHLPVPADLPTPAASAVGTIGYLIWFIGLIVGAIAFYQLLSLCLSLGLAPVDLKLATGLFVLIMLGVPGLRRSSVGILARERMRE